MRTFPNYYSKPSDYILILQKVISQIFPSTRATFPSCLSAAFKVRDQGCWIVLSDGQGVKRKPDFFCFEWGFPLTCKHCAHTHTYTQVLESTPNYFIYFAVIIGSSRVCWIKSLFIYHLIIFIRVPEFWNVWKNIAALQIISIVGEYPRSELGTNNSSIHMSSFHSIPKLTPFLLFSFVPNQDQIFPFWSHDISDGFGGIRARSKSITWKIRPHFIKHTHADQWLYIFSPCLMELEIIYFLIFRHCLTGYECVRVGTLSLWFLAVFWEPSRELGLYSVLIMH